MAPNRTLVCECEFPNNTTNQGFAVSLCRQLGLNRREVGWAWAVAWTERLGEIPGCIFHLAGRGNLGMPNGRIFVTTVFAQLVAARIASEWAQRAWRDGLQARKGLKSRCGDG